MHRRSPILAAIAALVLVLASCGSERPAADSSQAPARGSGVANTHAGEGPAWAAWDAGLARAQKQRRLVVVDVYTDWCGWCKRMDADVYARADVRGYLAEKFVSIKLDAESDAALTHQGKTLSARELARGFGVDGYPTTIFLDADGKHLANVPGYLSPERFMLLLRYLGDGHQARGVAFEDYQAQAERS